MIRFQLNGDEVEYAGEAEKPILWVLRDEFALTGSKYNCGMGLCGACMVQLDQQPVRACITPINAAQGRKLTSIEGLSLDHPVKQAWIKLSVPQCGYCQSGQIIAADHLLRTNPSPDDKAIDVAMAGNLCRCGTYPRIRQAIKLASETLLAGTASVLPAVSDPKD